MPTDFVYRSVYEVDAEEVQDQRAKDEISECALVRDALKLGLVFGVGLDAEGCGKDELANGCAEAGEEGVEGLYVWISFCSFVDGHSRSHTQDRAACRIQKGRGGCGVRGGDVALDYTYEVAHDQTIGELQHTNHD
jgi:hypothetical protein